MDTKTCSGCQKTKSTKEFNFKDKKRKLYHSRCRSCTNQASKKHYEENKEIYKDRARRHSKKQIESNRNKLIEYLSGKACVDCGENDPVVLHFDHVRGKTRATGSRSAILFFVSCACLFLFLSGWEVGTQK